jgi:flavin-binding protein dodecin
LPTTKRYSAVTPAVRQLGTQVGLAPDQATTALSALVPALPRSAKTRNVRGAWITEQHVRCVDGRVTEYQVNMMVTFILDD